MGRRYPDRPVLGVGAVVLAGGQVLLVQRGQPPSQGLWSLPGGAVELGEGLMQAVAREVREETGLTVEVGPLVGVFERLLEDAQGRLEYHYVLLDYLCQAQLMPPRAGDDAAAARWVALGDLDQAGLTPDTIQVIRRAAALHKG
ncbi:MAG: NUDIX hydrolase [Desulfarculus sp.]|nr:NUDIX hydrolase [Desulfarculus sp.]